MASQYSLNLKAVLDTTQVKQELQKLRQMQNQILGNNRGNSVSGGTSNSNNLGNINGLNSTLSRLTNSINQLNNAITKLNTFNQKTIQSNSVVAGRNNIPFTLALGDTNSRITSSLCNLTNDLNAINQVKFLFDTKHRTNLIKQYGSLPLLRQYNPNLLQQKTGFTPQQYDTLNNTMLNGGLMGSKWYNENLKLYNRKGVTPFLPSNNKQQNGLTPEMKRMMLGLGINQGINAALNMNQQLGLGNDTLFSIGGQNINSNDLLGGVNKIGSYAIMGSAAGIPGAVIGGFVGALEMLTDVIIKNAKQAEAELAEWNARVEAGGKIKKAGKEYFDSIDLQNAFKENDVAKVLATKAEIEEAKKWDMHNYNVGIKNNTNAGASYYNGLIEDIQRNDAKLTAIDNFLENFQKTKAQYNQTINGEFKSLSRSDELRSNADIIKRITRNKNLYDAKEALQDKESFYSSRASQDKKSYQSLLAIAKDYANSGKFKLADEQMNLAMRAKNSWQFNQGEADKFKNAIPLILNQITQMKVAPLQDALSKLQAPNMENVNSLASQGVMINRADDVSREQSILDYQREQTDLQRKIKDLLEVEDYTNQAPIIQ